MTGEELVKIWSGMAEKMSDKPHLVFLKTADTQQAIEVASRLSRAMSRHPQVILAERVMGESHPLPWRLMRTRLVVSVADDGSPAGTRTELILPHDRPVILLARDFQRLSGSDQLAYAHMADDKDCGFRLHPGSVLIAAYAPGSKLDPFAVNRGTVWELGSEKAVKAKSKK